MFLNHVGHVARALTVAGSDSSGGAGIQADLKTMHQFAVYGMSALTALTAQNTLGVQGILEVDANFVRQQLESVYHDMGVDAVKTGMLANAQIIEQVAQVFIERSATHIVVDPVMIAKGGHPLIANTAIDALKQHLLPLAEVLTPNIPEAEVLSGQTLRTWADFHQAILQISKYGSQCMVLKGGHADTLLEKQIPWLAHMAGNLSIDIVYYQKQFTYFLTPRIKSYKTHGTGCTFSAAITALLAKQFPLLDAIATAKAFIYQAINNAMHWDLGAGHGPIDHSAVIFETHGIQPNQAYLFDGTSWSVLHNDISSPATQCF